MSTQFEQLWYLDLVHGLLTVDHELPEYLDWGYEMSFQGGNERLIGHLVMTTEALKYEEIIPENASINMTHLDEKESNKPCVIGRLPCLS